MARKVVANIAASAYDAVFRPHAFVAVTGVRHRGTRAELFGEIRQVVGIYLLNLLTYAIPLTVAGFGKDQVPEPLPAALEAGVSPGAWTFGYAVVQNSLFISAATLLTLATFHAGVVVTRQSNGILASTYSVVYSTSVYLAGIFTTVWYLSTAPGLETARRFVVDAQKQFIYFVIDALGANVGVPGGRPTPGQLSGLSGTGSLVLTFLVVLCVYFFLSLYLASRVNHRTGRVDALVVVAGVAFSPVVYVTASIVAVSTL